MRDLHSTDLAGAARAAREEAWPYDDERPTRAEAEMDNAYDEQEREDRELREREPRRAA